MSSDLPIVSDILPDGTIIETVYDPVARTTAFAVAEPERDLRIEPHYLRADGVRLVPYAPTNNLLTTGCVLLASDIGELRDIRDVVQDTRAYLNRYVDLSPEFLTLAPYYVLLTWVFDRFRELPMLRFQGDYGTGKTRALLALGSICYKPFFASGASTVSPIFHILDTFRGTLILDEADFRFSDMTGELVKILNNGTVDGLPVLRTMTNRHGELNPRAFRVYGPKILAMRERFSDDALESRLLTEQMQRRTVSPHIPVHTPDQMREEARELRNRFLAWRLTHWHTIAPNDDPLLSDLDARTRQMGHAVLSLVEDEHVRAQIAGWLGGLRRTDEHARLETPDALLVRALAEAIKASGPHVPIAAVARRFNNEMSARGHVPMSNKWIGAAVRRLGLSTTKSRGTYGIPIAEHARIRVLADRLGFTLTPTADDNSSSVTLPTEPHA